MNANRVLSRSFKRNLASDRFIKVPFEVRQKNVFFSKTKFLFFSILKNIQY
jgi:hypothetical protein